LFNTSQLVDPKEKKEEEDKKDEAEEEKVEPEVKENIQTN